MEGHIKTYRQLLHSDLWLCEPFTRGQAWIDLIGLANSKDGFIRVRGNKITVKRGQVGFSEVTLAKRWQWSRGKFRRFIGELEMEQQIVQQKSKLTSLISILNYEKYQSSEQQENNRRDTNNNNIYNTDSSSYTTVVAKGTESSTYIPEISNTHWIQKYVINNCNNLSTVKYQLTDSQCKSLEKDYPKEKIQLALDDLDTKLDTSKYFNIYKPLVKFIKAIKEDAAIFQLNANPKRIPTEVRIKRIPAC